MKNLIGISGKISSGKDTVGKIIQVICHLQKMNIPFSVEAVLYNMKENFSGNSYYGDWHIKKFAGKLKQITALLTGCNVSDLEDQEFKNKLLSEEWNQSTQYNGKECYDCGSYNNTYVMSDNPTYRELLQVIGTESMRNVIHENVWVNALFADYRKKYTSGHTLVDPKVFDEEEEEDWSTDYPKWIITDTRFPNEAEAIKSRGGIVIRIERATAGEASTHPSETALDNYHFDYTIFNNGTMEQLIYQVQTILKAEKII